eukprot:GGOE01023617.1.p1 GENE.GGOE01023617.1~~GGOE01023617.1.p1  ORF type:complete len:1013 (+),score=245.60 GGOE01023617.1:92-3130(+)
MFGQGQGGNDSPQHQALMQLARAETVQEAEQLLAEMCLNQPTRISTLDAMIQQIQQNGIHPSSACCSAIITAFVDAGLLDRAKAYLQYIRAQHKDLPLRTYNVLIDAFGKAQDFQTMEELYELLLAEGITPNVITYNTMLFAFGKAGRFAKMDSFFNQMLQDHATKGSGEPCVTRDVTTFITLMDAHGRAGHIEQMEIYHRAMLAAGHKPSLKVYNALLSAYGKAQDIEQMTYYVNKMEANGIPPNTGSYNILIGVFGKMGKIDVMEQFYTALRQSGLNPDVFTFNSMLAAYGKALNEEKIHEVWQEMLSSGVQPNIATYQNAIEAYSRLGHISMMEAMYHEAMRKGMQLGVWAYSSLLAAYCNAGDTPKVETTFESMAVHKVHPNVRCFSSVIKAHAKAGDVETMEKRFRQLMASPGNRPDLEIFVTVIKGYGPKYADRAINVFLAMKPSRVMPTVAACHAILEVCGEMEDAKELRRLWAHIPQFCKDAQCCKMYSDIMARLGETDVLGVVAKEDGMKATADGGAAPHTGKGGGKNAKRHPRGRYTSNQGEEKPFRLPFQLPAQEPSLLAQPSALQQAHPSLAAPSLRAFQGAEQDGFQGLMSLAGLGVSPGEVASGSAFQLSSQFAPQLSFQAPVHLQHSMQAQHQLQDQSQPPPLPIHVPSPSLLPPQPFLSAASSQSSAFSPVYGSDAPDGESQLLGGQSNSNRRNRQRPSRPQSSDPQFPSGATAFGLRAFDAQWQPNPEQQLWQQQQLAPQQQQQQLAPQQQQQQQGPLKAPAFALPLQGPSFGQLAIPNQPASSSQQPSQRKGSKGQPVQQQQLQQQQQQLRQGSQQFFLEQGLAQQDLQLGQPDVMAQQWWEAPAEAAPTAPFQPSPPFQQLYPPQGSQQTQPLQQQQQQLGQWQRSSQLQMDPLYGVNFENGALAQSFLQPHISAQRANPATGGNPGPLLQSNAATQPYYPLGDGAITNGTAGYAAHLFMANAPNFPEVDPTGQFGSQMGTPPYSFPVNTHRT